MMFYHSKSLKTLARHSLPSETWLRDLAEQDADEISPLMSFIAAMDTMEVKQAGTNDKYRHGEKGSVELTASGVADAPAVTVAATVIVSPAVALVGTAMSAIAPSVRGVFASTRTMEPAGASASDSASSTSPSVRSTSGRPSDAARSTAARTREP